MHRPTLTAEYWARAIPGSARDGVAVSEALRVLRRAWAWILMPTLAVAAAATAFVLLVPPRYTAETKILLENRDPTFARTGADRAEPAPLDEQGVASQVQVAMSRDLAREAIRRLKLVGNPEFDPSVAEVGPLRRALMMLGLGKVPADAKPEDRVLETYFERLLVYPQGKSRILSVEFRAGSPTLAAEAANTISELYLSSLEAAKVDTARYASSWLGTNIDTLRARVAEAEARVEAFRAKNGLVGAGGASGQPIVGQQLGELSSQLSQARTIKADLSGRVKLLKEMIKEGRAFEIPDVANNELIRRTVESRMTLRAQLALEARTLLPGHPRMKELTAQLDDLETQIKAAAERIVRTLENDAKIAGARVESLQATVDGQREVVAQGNTSEIQLRALEREAKVQREQLESYLSRFREASARNGESATPAEARIVSRAVVPETPSFPKKIPVVSVATALAFMLSAAAVLGRHLLKTPAEAERPARDHHRVGAGVEAESGAIEAGDLFADRFDYPEPMPPQRSRPEPVAGSAQAGFRTPYTANISFPRLVVEHGVVRAVLAEAPVPAASERPPAARQGEMEATAPASPFDLDTLIDRLRTVRTQSGRCVLVIETEPAANAAPGLADSLAAKLSIRARTLSVEVGGAHEPGAVEMGLSDLVAGEAAFLDVIQRIAGSRRHGIGPGLFDREVLLEEPQGLAVALTAMTQAYAWTIWRLDASACEADDGFVKALVSGLSACMDSVVIASEAEADDPALVALYDLATEAGPGQILVARNRIPAVKNAEPEMQLRLSA